MFKSDAELLIMICFFGDFMEMLLFCRMKCEDEDKENDYTLII